MSLRSTRPALLTVILLSLGLLIAACTPAEGEPVGPAAPERPTAGDDPAPGPPEMGNGALEVLPVEGIQNPRPHAWERIEVAPDGRSLTVYYFGGTDECYGLDRVDVEQDADGRPSVTVYEGELPDLPPETACVEVALLKATPVDLEQPLIAPAQ
jgi:hypothetical protein